MMNIVVFDPSGSHGTFAFTQSRVFDGENIEWFIHKDVSERLHLLNAVNDSSKKVHTLISGDSKFIYYLKSIAEINNTKCDILFFNTLQSDWVLNFLFLLFIKKPKNIVLTVHNVNSFFDPRKQKGLRSFIRERIKLLAIKKCSFNVYGAAMKAHMSGLVPQAKISTLPYQIYLPSQVSDGNGSKKFNVVIPGSVDLRRRDYVTVLQTIKTLSYLKHIRFVLLGAPSGEGADEMMNEFEKFPETVICFRKFVDDREYEKHMLDANLILGPLYKFFDTNEATEEYGISKETGITFAIIRYALPGIFSSQVKVMDEIRSGVMFYDDSSHLAATITQLSTDNERYLQLKQQAHLNSKKFEAARVKEVFLKEIIMGDSR
jgi:hypothetical protein